MATNEIPNFRDLEREIGLTEIFNPADCGGTTEIEELKQQIWNLKDRVKNLENLAEIGSSKKTDPSKFISKAHMLQTPFLCYRTILFWHFLLCYLAII